MQRKKFSTELKLVNQRRLESQAFADFLCTINEIDRTLAGPRLGADSHAGEPPHVSGRPRRTS